MKKLVIILVLFGSLATVSCNRKSHCPTYDSAVKPAQK
jgi:hypothetical protein